MIGAMTNSSKSIPAQVRSIANLLAFSKRSGIPHRTLVRIKAGGDDYPLSQSTRLAIEHAIKRFKPEMKGEHPEAAA